MKTEIVSLRLPSDLCAALRTLADRYDMSLSELLRVNVTHETDKYLSSICLVERQQADEIKQAIYDMLNDTHAMTFDLKKIGNNYNQIAHKLNATVPRATSGYDAIKQQVEHETAKKDAADLIEAREIPIMIEKYIQAAAALQDAIKEIQKAVI